MKRIWMKRRGKDRLEPALLNSVGESVFIDGQSLSIDAVSLDVPISGTVYNVLFNYKKAYEMFRTNMYKPPYEKPPKYPVLYMKPMNTLIAHRSSIPVPASFKELMIGPSLGLVIGKRATKVKEQDALSYIKGLIIANDVQIPHSNYYRPAIKETARDGFCPIGPWIVEHGQIENIDQLQIRVFINGRLALENNTSNLLRSARQLIASVTDFMTLTEGDVLLTGIPENAPLAKRKDIVTIEIERVGRLENELVDEAVLEGGRG
ncbi:fumarylacetoacetate hydrolase family protein [Fervidibacillus albus]|uniref:Fumarylacetoacetate hydrolase family protein n=1 Tax=Fervidibacillus albus TaxID=2980026 RepID=A0A9E8LWE4_9BACI|nr:fumarylacetoacetate hydrolase family protein [Fervidibacillus albus]WAA10943.1 fumarylacetoacetate hydrolase family protein [Fervidibacillus albus]